MTKTNSWEFSLQTRALPLLANLVVVGLIALGMLEKGAQTDYKVHALIECMLSLMAFFIIGVAFYLRKREDSRFFLTIALAFMGTWVLETWHVFSSLDGLTSGHLLASQEFSTSSWIAPRLYLAVFLCMSLGFREKQSRFGEFGERSDFPYYIVAALLIPAVLMTVLSLSRANLDAFGLGLPRPEELVPGVLFSAALIGYIARGNWRASVFEFYLLFAIALNIVMHFAVMSQSAAEFDSYYAVAHLCKFVSYIIVLVGLILYGRDASSNQLQCEKQRAESILEIMLDGIVTIDSRTVIRSINPAGCQILGRPQDAIIGQKLSHWIPALEEYVAADGSAVELRALEKQLELDGHRPDGSTMPLELTLKQLPDTENLRYVGALRDISERRETEIERVNLTRQLQTALQAAGLGKWEWSSQSLEMSWDAQSDKIFGLAKDTGGLSLDDLRAQLHPEDLERMKKKFEEAESVADFREQEFRIRRKDDNEERWIAVSGTHLLGETDEDDRFVGVLADITSYKSNVAELTQAREAADEASQVKSAFLANMSHEIRTPMNGVVGMLDVLQQSQLNSKQTDMVDVIKESAFSLLHLIDDILDFSKIEAGKLAVEIAPMNVSAVMDNVCASLDLLAKEKGVELALFTDPQLPKGLLGDSLRLRQILVNLVNNAIKFSKDNGRTGKVSMRALLLEEDERQAVVEFRIVDNGIGMTPEVQNAVFDIFVQADNSTSRRFGGTGLGLTISKNLVEMMNGEIDLHSAPGEGSTFTVRLKMQKTRTAVEDKPVACDLSGLSCLLIEEPDGCSDDLATYLRHAGAAVDQVREVTESLFWLNTQSQQKRVCIIDGGASHLSAAERKLLERDNLGIVLIQRERRQLVSHIESALVHNGNAMNRRHFLHLVGVAAGKMTMEDEPATTVSEPVVPHTPAAPSREEAIRNSQLILVAEDNPVNQQVVLEQLSVLGYRADVADNGVEALKMWGNGGYSLLLTDLQMPEMDGYALTASVRKQETDGSRIPIVALSADALVGEAEKSQEVGMDDYLSKPARLDDLRGMLEKWLQPHGTETLAANEPNNAAPTSAESSPGGYSGKAINIKILTDLVGDNPDLIASLLNDYCSSAAEIRDQLLDAWRASDWDEVATAAHKLKSSSLSVGASPLGEMCGSIEAHAKDPRNRPCIDEITLFETEVAAVERAINQASFTDAAHGRPA